MRITCDSCGAKYSIADEKVRGKVFKIRCKKCSNIVVVRGTAGAGGAMTGAPDTAEVLPGGPGETDATDAPIWHLVIGREQVGPLTVAQVREHLERGEIDANSYVWREGYADWVRLATIPELVGPAEGRDAGGEQWARPGANGEGQRARDRGHGDRGQGGSPETAASLMQVGGAGRQASDGAFAAVGHQAADPHGGLFPAAAQDDATRNDLFVGVPAGARTGGSMFPGDDPGVGAGGEAGAGPRMTGQRGENSVLFSLANLQALATGGSTSGPTGTGFGAAPAAASGARGSSGLLDIRAMAAATVPAAQRRATGEDDLPALGGYSAPMAAAPVLFPTAVDERPSWLLPVLIGVGGLLLAVIAVLVVVLLKRPSVPAAPAPVVAAVSPGGAGTQDPAVGGAPAATPDPGTAPPARAPANAEAPPAADPSAAAGTGREPGLGGRAGDPSARPRPQPRRGVPDPAPSAGGVPAPPPADEAAGGQPPPRRPPRDPAPAPRDDLDNMLDQALAPRRGPAPKPAAGGAEAPAAAGALPERLSRSQIMDAMSTVKGRVQACYDRYKVPGLTNVQIKIAGSGRVDSAAVEGLFAGTETGACVEAAVRGARFPAFAAPSMSVKYPFMLR